MYVQPSIVVIVVWLCQLITVTRQLKPEHNSEPGVFVQRIPQSAYSIRLFPGAQDIGEYCMDIVRTDTGQPVNSPFAFELWAVDDLDAPWLSITLGGMRTDSLERRHGIAQDDIEPGAEKFLLSEGQDYLLKRPGYRDLRFKAPLRDCPRRYPVPEFDLLSFPQKIKI